MSAMASQITSLTIVYSTVYFGADQRKRVTGLCAGSSPVTDEMANDAEKVSIWWRHRDQDANFEATPSICQAENIKKPEIWPISLS